MHLREIGKPRILGVMNLKRACVVAILFLAFCGIADSAYIAQKEADNAPLICSVNNLSGCNIVAASRYSRLFGISLAEYGIVFYSAIFILAALEIVLFQKILRRLLQGISFVGVIAALYFTFTEIFLIKALCIYCLASAFITLLVFIFAALIEPMRRRTLRT